MKKIATNFLFYVYSFLILLFVTNQNYAQTISGKVTTLDNQPVKNARIWIINNDNIYEQFNTYTDSLGNYSLLVTGIKDKPQIPSKYKLEQNYPNPFSVNTEIEFSAPKEKNLTVKIYDILGREVKSFNIEGTTGNYLQRLKWDGTNNNGIRISAGIYFYQLKGADINITKKMLFMPGVNNFYPSFSSLPEQPLNKKYNRETKDYEIVVTNINGTSPLINAQKISSVNMNSDTTINFTVERKVDPGYYIYALYDNIIFVIDTYTNAVIDSIEGFSNYPNSFEITSNNKMYVSTDSYLTSSNIYSVDLISKDIKIIKSYKYQSNEAYASVFYKNYNDTVFIITNNPNSNLKYVGIIENDSVKYFDSLDIDNIILGYKKQSIAFDQNSAVFYVMNSNNYLFAYNYALKEITRTYKNIYAPLHMLVSDNNKYMYVSGGPVFDFHKDSVIAWLGGNNLGSLALNNDDSKLYITDPGHYENLEYPQSGYVFVYNTSSFSYTDSINVHKSNLNEWKVTDQIEVVPNTNLAYVSSWGDDIYLIDLKLNEVIQIISIKQRQVILFLLKKK